MQDSQKRCPHGSTSGFRSAASVGLPSPSAPALFPAVGGFTAAATCCARSSGVSSASAAAAPEHIRCTSVMVWRPGEQGLQISGSSDKVWMRDEAWIRVMLHGKQLHRPCRDTGRSRS